MVFPLNSLATTYFNQGGYADAELLYKRALVVSEKAFGPDDPHVAVLLNSLGVLFDNRDATRMFKPKEVGYRPPSFYAEPELREALVAREVFPRR